MKTNKRIRKLVEEMLELKDLEFNPRISVAKSVYRQIENEMRERLYEKETTLTSPSGQRFILV